MKTLDEIIKDLENETKVDLLTTLTSKSGRISFATREIKK